MYNKVFLVCAIIAAAKAIPVHIQEHHAPILVLQDHHHQPKGHAVSSQSIVSHHSPSSKSYGGHHYEHEDEHDHPSYKFEYSVHDDHTKDIKSQSEHRDGDQVQGSYSLLQPDGHIRNVKYQADKHNGFNAEVSYTGGSSHHY